MAIVQISQIQIRRGLQQDLPQLASAEFGWSLDQRRLYIGNGTIEEGAPTEGVTEILTQYSNFLSTIPNYTFAGTDAGYTSQTGPSTLSPVTRTLQSVLDDIVTVRDFGATGNGSTDDTAALNRAIQQIYKSSLNGTHTNVQRTIKIPAGTYIVSGPLYIPPNCTLIGDGKNSTVISAPSGATILKTADSAFQYEGGIGTNGATYPSYIYIAGIKFSSGAGTAPVVTLDSATTVSFDSVYFQGASTVTNLVTTAATHATTRDITFTRCVFDGGVHGFNSTGTTVGVRIKDSSFKNNSSVGFYVSSYLDNTVSSGNYYYSSVPDPLDGPGAFTGNNISIADTSELSYILPGIYNGSYLRVPGNTWVLSTGTTTITNSLTYGHWAIDYRLYYAPTSSYRFGTLRSTSGPTGTTFDDDYTESGISVGANLFVSYNGTLTCTVPGTTTFDYSIKQFI